VFLATQQNHPKIVILKSALGWTIQSNYLMDAEVDVDLLVKWKIFELASLGIVMLNFAGYKHFKNTET
jgi:hypothetical protein